MTVSSAVYYCMAATGYPIQRLIRSHVSCEIFHPEFADLETEGNEIMKKFFHEDDLIHEEVAG